MRRPDIQRETNLLFVQVTAALAILAAAIGTFGWAVGLAVWLVAMASCRRYFWPGRQR